MTKDKNYRKMYYETLIELLELKIKNWIDVDENLKLLKRVIVESFEENKSNLKFYSSYLQEKRKSCLLFWKESQTKKLQKNYLLKFLQ